MESNNLMNKHTHTEFSVMCMRGDYTRIPHNVQTYLF